MQGIAATRRTLLAERLGKPSPWVMINEPWYNSHRAAAAQDWGGGWFSRIRRSLPTLKKGTDLRAT